MRQDFETPIEYLEENSSLNTQENEEIAYNRRNVDNIKKFIMCSFIVACTIPVFFCLYLMVKLNKLDDRADELENKLAVEGQLHIYGELSEATENISNNDAYLLDKDAASDLEKDPGESTHVLMDSESEKSKERLQRYHLPQRVEAFLLIVSTRYTLPLMMVLVNTQMRF